jgi:tetratricopeptide (TPR) repeat protein
MRMYSFIAAILALACLAFQPAMAAYTEPLTDSPTANQRIKNAQEAIAAQNWPAALNELRIALRDAPNNADLHNLLAFSYRKQTQPDLPRAFEHYKIALQLDPKHKSAHEYIGEAYLMDKKPAEAEKHLSILEQLCGNKTCEEYADLAKAIARYQRAGVADMNTGLVSFSSKLSMPPELFKSGQPGLTTRFINPSVPKFMRTALHWPSKARCGACHMGVRCTASSLSMVLACALIHLARSSLAIRC